MAKARKRKRKGGNKIAVFVYGTLKRGGRLHGVMEGIGAEFLGEGKTKKGYLMYDLGSYPGVKKPSKEDEKKAYPIPGEVFLISAGKLRRLDAVEGYPWLYTRDKVEIEVDGKTVKAVMYFFNQEPPENAPLIREFNVSGRNHPLVDEQKDIMETENGRFERLKTEKESSNKLKVFVYGQLRKGAPLSLETNYRSVIEPLPEVVEGVKTVQKYAMYHLGYDVGIKTPRTGKEKKHAHRIIGDVFEIEKKILDRAVEEHLNYFDIPGLSPTFKRRTIEVEMPDGTVEKVTTFVVNPKTLRLKELPLIDSYEPNGQICHLYTDKFPDEETLSFLAKRFSGISIMGVPISYVVALKGNTTRAMEEWGKTPANVDELRRIVNKFASSTPYLMSGRKEIFLFLNGNPAVAELLARYLTVYKGKEVAVPVWKEGRVVGIEPYPFPEKFREILQGTQKEVEKTKREIFDFIWFRNDEQVPDSIEDIVLKYFESEREEEENVQRIIEL